MLDVASYGATYAPFGRHGAARGDGGGSAPDTPLAAGDWDGPLSTGAPGSRACPASGLVVHAATCAFGDPEIEPARTRGLGRAPAEIRRERVSPPALAALTQRRRQGEGVAHPPIIRTGSARRPALAAGGGVPDDGPGLHVGPGAAEAAERAHEGSSRTAIREALPGQYPLRTVTPTMAQSTAAIDSIQSTLGSK